jgi:hypothetical protein
MDNLLKQLIYELLACSDSPHRVKSRAVTPDLDRANGD